MKAFLSVLAGIGIVTGIQTVQATTNSAPFDEEKNRHRAFSAPVIPKKLAKGLEAAMEEAEMHPDVLDADLIQKLLVENRKVKPEAVLISTGTWGNLKNSGETVSNIRAAIHPERIERLKEDQEYFNRELCTGPVTVHPSVKAYYTDEDLLAKYHGLTVETQEKEYQHVKGKVSNYQLKDENKVDIEYPGSNPGKKTKAILLVSLTFAKNPKEKKCEKGQETPPILSISTSDPHPVAVSNSRSSSKDVEKPKQKEIENRKAAPLVYNAPSNPSPSAISNPKSKIIFKSKKKEKEKPEKFKVVSTSTSTAITTPKLKKGSMLQKKLKKEEETQEIKRDKQGAVPNVLTSAQTFLLLGAGYDKGRKSTLAVDIGNNIFVSAKIGDEKQFDALKVAVHPDYGPTYQKYPSTTEFKVHPQIELHFLEICQPDYRGETVKTQEKKGEQKGGTIAKYEIFLNKKAMEFGKDSLVSGKLMLSITPPTQTSSNAT